MTPGQSQFPKLAMIAFDAAEIDLITAGIAAGWLPRLAKLREQGTFLRLKSDSDIMVGTVWPSFYSGLLPPEHGIFGIVQWRAETMRHERPDEDGWIDTTPFYRKFGDDGPRVLAIDAPFAPSARPFNGTEIVSWNAHAVRGNRGSWPEDLAARMQRRHGRPIMRDEIYGPQTAKGLLRLRDRLNATARQQSALARDLIGTTEWDLLVLGFGAAHRAGHKLQAPLILRDAASANNEVSDALRDVYVACDAAIGEVVDALPPGCPLIVFSLNGMVQNTSHHFLLPEMLRRILNNDRSDATGQPLPTEPLLHRIRKRVPLEWRSAVKENLPVSVKDGLGRYWRRAEARDWSSVRAFRLIGSDFEGQVRLNVRGRERDGIVAPGREYNELCEKLVQGLPSFVDADSGEPIIADVWPTAELWPDARERRDAPDLVVRWAHRSPMGLGALKSEHYGAFLNPWKDTQPDGRSGHHQPFGWALACGPGQGPGSEAASTHPVQDLTATVFAHFGLTQPVDMRGNPISELVKLREKE
ncbi:alkaline phosphatase family protein [Tropicimonas marinistellae]|uniref:alkaline phosphatase family protein n=1 Tax=Tropicimonas marinistellae TaxID=1739787 RepID=UPI00082C6C92|nr:alkaline phosphatase family protein [Tropicimonas marinistellae]